MGSFLISFTRSLVLLMMVSPIIRFIHEEMSIEISEYGRLSKKQENIEIIFTFIVIELLHYTFSWPDGGANLQERSCSTISFSILFVLQNLHLVIIYCCSNSKEKWEKWNEKVCAQLLSPFHMPFTSLVTLPDRADVWYIRGNLPTETLSRLHSLSLARQLCCTNCEVPTMEASSCANPRSSSISFVTIKCTVQVLIHHLPSIFPN